MRPGSAMMTASACRAWAASTAARHSWVRPACGKVLMANSTRRPMEWARSTPARTSASVKFRPAKLRAFVAFFRPGYTASAPAFRAAFRAARLPAGATRSRAEVRVSMRQCRSQSYTFALSQIKAGRPLVLHEQQAETPWVLVAAVARDHARQRHPAHEAADLVRHLRDLLAAQAHLRHMAPGLTSLMV